MLARARRRAQEERGVSLTELLVVILILGILFAIALPSFLSQTSSAYDAGAEALASTAEITADSIAAGNGGNYTSITGPSVLAASEASIQTASGVGSDAWLVAASGSSTGFTIDVEAADGYIFQVAQQADGSVQRSCGTTLGAAGVLDSGQSAGGCVDGSW
jgi:prepilin-type N-terminal cleavage/methylation domain-containing protein